MKWVTTLMLLFTGVALFLGGALAAIWIPSFSRGLPAPSNGWNYAGGADVPSGVQIDGPSIVALRIGPDDSRESADWERAYRRLKPGSVLRVLVGGPMSPEAFRLHFVCPPDQPLRFQKESADTISLYIGDEKRMSLREEKIQRARSGRQVDDTKWTVTTWGNP